MRASSRVGHRCGRDAGCHREQKAALRMAACCQSPGSVCFTTASVSESGGKPGGTEAHMRRWGITRERRPQSRRMRSCMPTPHRTLVGPRSHPETVPAAIPVAHSRASRGHRQLAEVHTHGVTAAAGVGSTFSLLTKHSRPFTTPSATWSVCWVRTSRSRFRKPVSMMAAMVLGSISEKAW
jgi:hypothetical protein